MTVLLAVAAGICFALAAAFQHRAAGEEASAALGDPRLLARLARQPLWLAGNVLDVLAIALQALALRVGTLVKVQPLLLSGLLLALPVEAALHRRPLHRRDLVGTAVGLVGLVGFSLAVVPAAGIDVPGIKAWASVAAGTGALVMGLLGLAARRSGTTRAVLLGFACGVLYGVTAALLKTCSSLVDHPLDLLSRGEPYALVLVGGAGLVLNQNAFQGARLAPGLVALSIAEPVIAVAIGVTAFHERISLDGGGLLVCIASVALLLGALAILASSQPAEHPAAG